MNLNVLWRSNVAASEAKTQHDLLRSDINLKVETHRNKAIGHKDWLSVLVDGDPDEGLLDAPNLRHVIVPYAGINSKLQKRILARPHLKLYNSHFNDAFVAQHAIALLLACCNHLLLTDQALRQGDWRPAQHKTYDSFFLNGKTCLLLGYGAIAKEIATRLGGFGMNMSVLRRSENPVEDLETYGPKDLSLALSKADVVMCSLPSTPETKNLLDKTAFESIKPGSILINVGRGDVIDQEALYEALKTNKLFAAGIDVWWNYPKNDEERSSTLPSDVPLHTLNNLIMSPHRANQVANWELASFQDVAMTLNALANREVRNEVDPSKGY